MNLVKALITKGVSQTGAVEVALGLPLSRVSDRAALSRFDIAAARESLLQGPRAPSDDISELLRTCAMSLGLNNPGEAALEYYAGLEARLQSKVQKDRLAGLNRSILNTEKQIEKLTVELARLLASHPKEWPLPVEIMILMGLFRPPPTLPPQAWEAQVRLLRSLIRNLGRILAQLYKEVAQIDKEVKQLVT